MTLATLLAMALTARLGVWQLSRASTKQAYVQAIQDRQTLSPLANADLADTPEQAQAQQHRPVQLRGTWLPGSTVFLENRQMNQRPGFFVIGVLLLAPGDGVVVQRGWVPRDAQERSRVAAPPLPEGPVEVVGRLALPPSRLLEFEASANGPIRQNLDIPAYARELRVRLRPLSVLQAGEEPGLRRDWPLPAADVGKHHGYAFQWFALSALMGLLYVWYQFIQPRRRARR